MGCCNSTDDSDNSAKRHPLLRENHVTSDLTLSPTNPSPSSDTTQVASFDVTKSLNPMETRAYLDAIRGPPVMITLSEDPKQPPNILRGNLKGFMKMEFFQVPEDIPVPMWYRLNLKDIIEHVRFFNSIVRANCNGKNCKTMTGAPEVEYRWTYNKEGYFSEKINKRMSAQTYIDKVIDTSSMLLKNHLKKSIITVAPITEQATKTIVNLVFRVYCHILYHHHDVFVESYALLHLNNCFTWFILFSMEAQLLDDDEAKPLEVLIRDILRISAGDPIESRENGLSISHDERLSSFFSSFSDDVSKLTSESYNTTFTLYSGQS